MVKWLIVPVEVKARDFASRLLLSSLAARKGVNVLFGSQAAIFEHMDKLPKGVYFDKSISKNKYDLLKKRVDDGHVLVNIDEEGLNSYANKLVYLNQRVSEKTLNLTKLFFTWGEDESSVLLKAHPRFKKNVVATGSPRIDLLRPEFASIHMKKAEEYRQKYGRYILHPSNFAAKHALGKEFVINQAKAWNIIKTKKDEETFQKLLNYKAKSFARYQIMLGNLASAHPDHTIIVRPHPADDHKGWNDLLKKHKNIKVVFEGVITPWILGADVIIHDSCTTGLESYLLGKKVIAYCPVTSYYKLRHISNEVGIRVEKEEELLKLIEDLLTGKKDYEKISREPKHLKRVIASIKGEYASQKILKQLLKLKWPDSAMEETRVSLSPKQRIVHLRQGIEKHILHPLGLFRRAINYRLQKFPGSSKGEVENLLAAFDEVLEQTSQCEVKEITRDLYQIKVVDDSK